MPYITQEKRNNFDDKMKDLLNNTKELTDRDLNYIISNLLLTYIENKEDGGINYKNCNSITGILECVKLEFYRKLVSPYEDKKIKENYRLYPQN